MVTTALPIYLHLAGFLYILTVLRFPRSRRAHDEPGGEKHRGVAGNNPRDDTHLWPDRLLPIPHLIIEIVSSHSDAQREPI